MSVGSCANASQGNVDIKPELTALVLGVAASLAASVESRGLRPRGAEPPRILFEVSKSLPHTIPYSQGPLAESRPHTGAGQGLGLNPNTSSYRSGAQLRGASDEGAANRVSMLAGIGSGMGRGEPIRSRPTGQQRKAMSSRQAITKRAQGKHPPPP